MAYVLFGLLHLPLSPGLHRFLTQSPYLLDQPVFGVIRALEISGSVVHYREQRCNPASDLRVFPQSAHNFFVTYLARLHFALSFG